MDNKEIPRHIAIIMDGNRRWAKKQGLPPFEGHRRGYHRFKEIAEQCWKMGVKILTVYAFSSENWKRDKKEVSFLMKLSFMVFMVKIRKLIHESHKRNFVY